MIYIVIMVALLLYLFKDEEESIGYKFSEVAIGALLGVTIWVLIGGYIGCYLPCYEYEQNSNIIYTLEDSESTYGVKYLFSGYIDEKIKYRYIVKTNKGKAIREKDYDECYIEEINNNNKNNRIVKMKTKLKYKWNYLFANDIFVHERTYYKFYVPKGSVINEYKIDLK